MTPRQTVLSVLSRVSGVPEAKIEDHHHLTADLGMDSVTAVEFLAEAMEALGVELDIESTAGVETVADCIAMAEQACG
ncbi:MAG: acyl carrier protein [Myxococcota bacterium]